MAGYRWIVKMRTTPTNGLQEVFDLTDGFAGAVAGEGRESQLTNVRLQYREEIEGRETVNVDLRPLMRGYRPEIRLTFQFIEMQHYRILANIMTRLIDPSWKVELSLNNGSTYREVELARAASPRPFRDKTVAGALFELELRATSTVEQFQHIESGTGW